MLQAIQYLSSLHAKSKKLAEPVRITSSHLQRCSDRVTDDKGYGAFQELCALLNGPLIETREHEKRAGIGGGGGKGGGEGGGSSGAGGESSTGGTGPPGLKGSGSSSGPPGLSGDSGPPGLRGSDSGTGTGASGAGSRGAGDGAGGRDQTSDNPETDSPEEPEGRPDGNHENFNGYNVADPSSNKAVTALNKAIADNTPDKTQTQFDQEIPDSSGKNVRRYNPAELSPDLSDEPTYEGLHSAAGDSTVAAFKDTDVAMIDATEADESSNPTSQWRTVDITSVKEVADPEKKGLPVVWLAVNKDGSALVVKSSDAEADGNDVKMLSSDLIFQGMGLVRDRAIEKPDLKVIARQRIKNKGTINTVQQAYSENGFNWGDKAVFSSKDDKNTPKGRAFDAIMQTKNVEVTNFLLADHHQFFGNKVIDKIVILRDTTDDRGYFHIVIVLKAFGS